MACPALNQGWAGYELLWIIEYFVWAGLPVRNMSDSDTKNCKNCNTKLIIKRCNMGKAMVLILDGNSEKVANALS